MKFLFSFLFLFISAFGFAQFDFSSKTLSIPPTIKKAAPVKPEISEEEKKVNPFTNPLPVSPSRNLDLSGGISMTKSKKFQNPGDDIAKDLNKKLDKQLSENNPNIDYSVFRRNEFFGDFNTDGDFFIIRMRDNQIVDGDQLAMYVNDQLQVPRITIDSDYQEFKINLVPGLNTIEFLMLNEGELSPNTTQYVVLDYKKEIKFGKVYSQATGFRAKIIVNRTK